MHSSAKILHPIPNSFIGLLWKSICSFVAFLNNIFPTAVVKNLDMKCTGVYMGLLYLMEKKVFFSSSISSLVRQWLGATLEFGHKEWLWILETLQTFGQSDVYTKRQTDKKILWCQGSFALLWCLNKKSNGGKLWSMRTAGRLEVIGNKWLCPRPQIQMHMNTKLFRIKFTMNHILTW